MNSKAIYQKANALVRQTGTRDAEKIAKDIGIWIFDEPSFQDLLGMYTFRWNHRLIFLNPYIALLAHSLRGLYPILD